MKPQTEATTFGSITIDGRKYSHDVLIRLDGQLVKRKKKLSKKIYGTSHKISLDEARHIDEEGAEQLLIGSGQYDRVRLSEQAEAYFAERGIRVDLAATPQAIKTWNQSEGKVIGLFHVTC